MILGTPIALDTVSHTRAVCCRGLATETAMELDVDSPYAFVVFPTSYNSIATPPEALCNIFNSGSDILSTLSEINNVVSSDDCKAVSHMGQDGIGMAPARPIIGAENQKLARHT